MTSTETKPESTQNLEPIVFLEEEEDFNQLYEESLIGIKEQDIVHAKVSEVGKDFVIIDFGYKSDCRIPLEEFQNFEGEIDVQAGDTVEVYVEALEDEDGVTQLSKRKAEKLRTWQKIGEIFEEGGLVRGMITARIKGGLSVDIGVKAFLPGSQVDLRPVRNLDKLLGESFDFKILKYNQKRGNIVLSRRALLEIDREEKRKKTLQILKEGAVITGHVKNITDYGVFVDLGGVDGLLHITDMTWGRIVHPSEMFGIGDEVEVLILKYFPDDQKVSLGLKQLSNNPWEAVEKKYEIGTRVGGKIVSITDYGAFVDLGGLDGLLHITDISWSRVTNPAEFLNLGDEIDVKILSFDKEKLRVSLGLKQIQNDPWENVESNYAVGGVYEASVSNITDYGCFAQLEEGIEGLIHLSELDWTSKNIHPSKVVEMDQKIKVMILEIDHDKRRISLGLKQTKANPWTEFANKYGIGDKVDGQIKSITDFGIFVGLEGDIDGLIHLSDISEDEDPKEALEQYKKGDKLDCIVFAVDAERERISLKLSE